jgi:site-specific DNA-cytosine methylase
MTDEQTVWEYDGYNQKIDDSGVHRTLRIGRDSSDFIAYGDVHLFEPMSMREENWAESDVKNALRAGASKSSHAITLNAMHGHDTHVIGYEEPMEIETITTSNERMLPGGHDMTEQEANLVVRRLTPLECELLMGWDKGWTSTGVQEDGTEVQMADTHRYRMCGNGVVANVAEWFGVRYVQAKNEAQQ